MARLSYERYHATCTYCAMRLLPFTQGAQEHGKATPKCMAIHMQCSVDVHQHQHKTCSFNVHEVDWRTLRWTATNFSKSSVLETPWTCHVQEYISIQQYLLSTRRWCNNGNELHCPICWKLLWIPWSDQAHPLRQFSRCLKLFKCFVDDMLGIWTGTMTEWNAFKAASTSIWKLAMDKFQSQSLCQIPWSDAGNCGWKGCYKNLWKTPELVPVPLLNWPTPLEYLKVQSLEASIGTGYKTQTKQTTMPLSKDSCGDWKLMDMPLNILFQSSRSFQKDFRV